MCTLCCAGLGLSNNFEVLIISVFVGSFLAAIGIQTESILRYEKLPVRQFILQMLVKNLVKIHARRQLLR